MAFYSFIVWAPGDLDFPDHLLSLAEGRNTFNLLVPDVDSFVSELKDQHVRVLKVTRLDEATHDPSAEIPRLV